MEWLPHGWPSSWATNIKFKSILNNNKYAIDFFLNLESDMFLYESMSYMYVCMYIYIYVYIWPYRKWCHCYIIVKPWIFFVQIFPILEDCCHSNFHTRIRSIVKINQQFIYIYIYITKDWIPGHHNNNKKITKR